MGKITDLKLNSSVLILYFLYTLEGRYLYTFSYYFKTFVLCGPDIDNCVQCFALRFLHIFIDLICRFQIHIWLLFSDRVLYYDLVVKFM